MITDATSLKERSEVEPYRGFVCWDPTIVAQVINPEAAAPSTEVLLATHQPVPIARLDVGDAGRLRPVETVTEENVRDVIALSHADPLIVPIIGPSGSGKSHFVLWLKAALAAQEQPKRRVVYVEKGQLSLSSVVDKLLLGEEGKEFDALRDSVRKATAAMTEEQGAKIFRNELCMAIEALTAGSPPNEVREYVISGMPPLLYDSTYARHVLKDGGALQRATRTAMGTADEEVPEARFVAGDLPTTLHGDEERLGADAQEFLAALGDPDVRETTYQVLNEVRDVAMRRVFGVEPNQLVRLMGQLRRRLFERDPDLEIVLMIEDFTLLQGVQYELLEAMLVLPVREGKQVMCEMRAVIAVTRDRFSEILVHSDTLRTRLQSQGHVYSIDLHLAADETDALAPDDLSAFVARYLNAARLGPEAVASQSPEVANACVLCHHREKCHPAFGAAAGTAEEGYGLYPFNADLLLRLTDARAGRVNPRELLDTIRTTLVDEADALRHSRFPADVWARELLPEDPALRERIELPFALADQLRRTDSGERRVWLQTFWSSQREHPTDLDPGVHEAFAISPLGQRLPPKPPEPEPPPRPKGKKQTTTTVDDPIQRWVSGGELPGNLANRLRKAVRLLLLQRIGGPTLLIHPAEIDRIFPPESIDIEGAQGGGHGGREAITLHFNRADAVLFANVQSITVGGWSTVSPLEIPRVIAALDERAVAVADAFTERRQRWLEELPALVPALALAGLVSGHAASTSREDLLTAALRQNVEPTSNAKAWFAPLLNDLAVQAMQRGQARAVRFAAAARTTDAKGPVAIDASVLLPAIDVFRSTWRMPGEDLDKSVRALGGTAVRLESTLQTARAELEEWRSVVEQATGGHDLDAVVKRVDGVGARVRRRGLHDATFSLPARYASDAATTRQAVDGLLTEWDGLTVGDRISRLLKIDREVFDSVRRSTQDAQRDLQAALKAANAALERSRSKSGAASSRSATQAVSNLTTMVEELRDGAG